MMRCALCVRLFGEHFSGCFFFFITFEKLGTAYVGVLLLFSFLAVYFWEFFLLTSLRSVMRYEDMMDWDWDFRVYFIIIVTYLT